MPIIENVSISINTDEPKNTENPGDIILADIEYARGFLDIYFNDPKSGRNTRLTINRQIIEAVLFDKSVQR